MANETARKVAIVILNWNGLVDTKELLEDLKNINKDEFKAEVVLVDNASSDESVSYFKKVHLSNMNVHLVENNKNIGFAGGNNVGIKYALEKGFDYVLILNNDVAVQKDFLTKMVNEFESHAKVGAISPKIYFAKGFEFKKDKYKSGDLGKVLWYAGGKIDWKNVYGSTRGVDVVDKGQYEVLEETDFVTGTCLLTSREVLSKVGLFDERYFLYYEDTDLSQRIKKNGFKTLYTPKAHIWHKVARSSGIGSDLNDYYTTRNRLLFGFKYATLRTKIALFRESIKLLFIGRSWQRQGILDFYLGKFGKGSWGE